MRSSLTAMTTVALLYTLASLLTTSIAIPTPDTTPNKHYHQHIIKTRASARRYCGTNIVNVLRLLCDGSYYSPIKRSKLEDDYNHYTNEKFDLWDDIAPQATEFSEPKLLAANNAKHFIISPKQAFNLLSNGMVFDRKRRGIVDECCKKACTVRELYSYCD